MKEKSKIDSDDDIPLDVCDSESPNFDLKKCQKLMPKIKEIKEHLEIFEEIKNWVRSIETQVRASKSKDPTTARTLRKLKLQLLAGELEAYERLGLDADIDIEDDGYTVFVS